MKTEAEARAAALGDGITEDQINEQILAFYGYVSDEPTKDVVTGPVVLPATVKAAVDAIGEAARQNALPMQIATQFKTILGFIGQISGKVVVVLVTLMALNGCGDTTAVRKGIDDAAVSVKGLNEQHLAFEETFIQRYQTEETKRIQDLYESAMASATIKVQQQATRVVKVPVKAADGSDAYKDETRVETITVDMVPSNVATALQTQRVRLLQAMKQNVAKMREQQANICANAAHAAAYLEALNAYFKQQQLTYESLMAAETQMFSFLETFLKKDK